ncbi:MAG TPA: hypothetical protein VL728_13325 [Cyclobacteriaceae bacterium]|jgi:hypothetical protein|nr:hypothetical protein [Cyclobacteriaceae bacterium]
MTNWSALQAFVRMGLGPEYIRYHSEKKSYNEQYKKYDWIEVDLVKNESDFRPESYRPRTADSELKIIDHVDTSGNWEERKKICLGKVYYSLSELIAEAKDKDICADRSDGHFK